MRFKLHAFCRLRSRFACVGPEDKVPRGLWRRLALPVLMLLGGLSGSSGSADSATAERPFSGKGWAQFDFAGDSIHFKFIADYVRGSKGYAESQARRPWRVLDLQVAYHDLNDDGRPEMLLSYAEATTYHCGTGGCDMIVFQFRDGQWREIGEGFMFAPWVSDEKVGGYRVLFTPQGAGLRWNGKAYQGFCTETLPAEIRTADRVTCNRG